MDSCHGGNDELDDHRPGTITSNASVTTCSPCGHCVALCPTEAITHHKMDMGNFVDLDKGVAYDFDGFKSFVRGRRSSSFSGRLTGNR
jgi:MinD superfamily P-loop ATPase